MLICRKVSLTGGLEEAAGVRGFKTPKWMMARVDTERQREAQSRVDSKASTRKRAPGTNDSLTPHNVETVLSISCAGYLSACYLELNTD